MKAQFEIGDTKRALQRASNVITLVRLSNFESMSEYYNELLLCAEDIKGLNGEYTDEQFTSQLLSGLTSHYTSFIGLFLAEQNSPGTALILRSDVKSLFLRLLKEEATRKGSSSRSLSEGRFYSWGYSIVALLVALIVALWIKSAISSDTGTDRYK